MGTKKNSPPLPKHYERAHRKTSRALLTVEQRAVSLLRSTVKASTDRVLARLAASGETSPERIVAIVVRETPVLRATLESVLAEVRLDAKKSSSERITAEWALVVKDGGKVGFNIPSLAFSAAITPTDQEAITSSAASLTAQWSRGLAAAAWMQPDAASLSAAARHIDYPVRRTSTTESARAFQDARDEATDAITREHRKASWLPAIFKRWDATNDSRLCPRCSSRDYQLRPVGLSFSGGSAPGYEHVCCRCTEGLVFLPLVFESREEN